VTQRADTMPAGGAAGGAPAGGVVSERVRMAAVAAAAALRVAGVLRLDPGPARLYVTAGGGERVEGVTCVASPGGYEITVRLVCALVALPYTAEQTRGAILSAAAVAGVAVARVDVVITDIDTGDTGDTVAPGVAEGS
jgi:hypothetical protein